MQQTGAHYLGTDDGVIAVNGGGRREAERAD